MRQGFVGGVSWGETWPGLLAIAGLLMAWSYFHKLYALDITLPASALTKAGLEAAMSGHILAQAELMATYQKGDP